MPGTGVEESRWSSLRGDFTVDRLPATLATGLVMGLVNALLSVALMSLIFKGELSDALPVGVGVGLLASAVLAIAIAASSGFPGMYAGIQDSSAAILGVAAAAVATTVAAPDLADTVLAMMAVTSIATGVVFYLMATFRLGEIVRFMPFPVIGGLLAGTGYLIFDGAVDILRNGAALGDIDPVVIRGLLLPGLVFGILFFIASRRRWPSRVLLALLATGIGGFHLITQLSGVDRAASQGRGWLLGPFPEGSLWPGSVADALGGADWGVLAGEAPTLVAILLIVPVTLLLYLSALEVETETDLDSNAELRATGLANVAAGAVGGPPGHLYLADTLVAHQLLGNRRGAAVVAGISLVGVIIVGGSVLELLPQFVIGGLLLFVGLDFLVEWLWDSRNRMARLDYLLMLGIVVVIAVVGFLPGAIAGLAAAVAVFVYRYSRIDVVKHLLTGREHQSNIERPSGHAAYLQQQGDALLVLELQGFVFFGTANRIIDRVKDHVRDTPSARFVIFDFRQVTGVDSSAVALFERIALLSRDQNLTLVLTGLESRAHAQFAEFAAGYADVVEIEPDLDHGTARCEDRILEMSAAGVAPGRALPDGLEQRLGPHLVPRAFTQGERLMTQGDASPGMFLIMAGRANVLLEKDGEPPVRLRAVREGTVLGEISLYRGEPCTATVVADEGCEVLHLSPAAFDDLRRTDPTAAADLHLFVARTLAARVSHADRTIRSLQA